MCCANDHHRKNIWNINISWHTLSLSLECQWNFMKTHQVCIPYKFTLHLAPLQEIISPHETRNQWYISFIHSFIRSFIHSFICSFVHLFIRSLVHSVSIKKYHLVFPCKFFLESVLFLRLQFFFCLWKKGVLWLNIQQNST